MKATKDTRAPVAAVLTMDPASTTDAGIALRVLSRAFTPDRGRLRTPEWYWSGNVWTSDIRDRLCMELYRLFPSERVGILFAVSCTMFRGTAYGQGRSVGAVESTLMDLNFDVARPEEIADTTWRTAVFPAEVRAAIRALPQKERREGWKHAAIDLVHERYTLSVDDNAAESILVNDYVVRHREDLYLASGAPKRRSQSKAMQAKRPKKS